MLVQLVSQGPGTRHSCFDETEQNHKFSIFGLTVIFHVMVSYGNFSKWYAYHEHSHFQHNDWHAAYESVNLKFKLFKMATRSCNPKVRK